jgi:hypothetical protein
MLITITIAILFFILGSACTIAAGILIERRVMGRPGVPLEIAARLVEDYANEIGAPR